MVICPGGWHHEAMPERLSAAEAAATARRMWTLFEPAHVVSYFAAEPSAPVARACAEALPFPSGTSADADGQLTSHADPEPS